jgi:hypothetical protein
MRDDRAVNETIAEASTRLLRGSDEPVEILPGGPQKTAGETVALRVPSDLPASHR